MSASTLRPFAVGAIAVVVAVAPGSSSAQEQEPRSARAYCLKVASDKASEFESFAEEVGIPIEKSRVAAGEAKGFDLLRAVVPLGAEARCDYIAVFHYGLLPEALPTDRVGEYMKRAGLDQTAAQAIARWDALNDLVGLEWWWFAERVGPPWPKGGYVNINYWKIRPDGFDDYLAVERAYWKPMAEAYLAGGRKISWDLVGLWAPNRADGYQGMTIDAYHDWPTMMESQSAFEEAWGRVHPGLSFPLVEGFKQAVRTSTHSALFRVALTTTE